MVTIKQQLVPESNVKTRTFGRYNKRKFITIHETGNQSKGAGAQSHANLQSNTNPRKASWHWQVDDKLAIQSYDHKVSCWAGGDGRGDGNMHSIHIEICVNSDSNYAKAVENAAELVRYIMKEENLSVDSVVQHNHWSGKNCPTFLRSGSKGVNWQGFVKKLEAEVVQVSNPVKPSTVKKPAYPVAVSDRRGSVRLKSDAIYRHTPEDNGAIITTLKEGHTAHYYDIQGHWVRLGKGWVKSMHGSVVEITKEYKEAEASELYRVSVNEESVGAFGNLENIVSAVQKAVEDGQQKIVVEKVKGK